MLELEVAQHALASGDPTGSMTAIDRLLSLPGAGPAMIAAARLVRARGALAKARTETGAARRATIRRDGIDTGARPSIEAFASLGDVDRFSESVALLGQAYREIGEDGRLRQLPVLLSRRFPAREHEIRTSLAPILASVASTATIGVARGEKEELLLPDGARLDVTVPGQPSETVDALPIRIPLSGTTAVQLRVRLRDGRRIDLPLELESGDAVRLDVVLLSHGFVFVPDRSPNSDVTAFTPGFYIDRMEATQSDFAAFVRSDNAADLARLLATPGQTFLLPWRRAGSHVGDITFRTGEGNHPVTFVSPTEALRFATWRGAMLGIAGLRLPTEAEWIGAARGSRSWPFPWGSEWKENCCNAFEDEEVGCTVAVDEFSNGDSPCGARQLAGNASEIVQVGPGDFVARGGSYRNRRPSAPGSPPPRLLDARRSLAPNERDIDVGFRCAVPGHGVGSFPDGLPDAAVAGDFGAERSERGKR